MDKVDKILEQWQRERPDMDASPMGPIGRLVRCEALLRAKLDQSFAQFGINSWEFDVLATLRRAGKPYCLAPTELYVALMVSSGTMTNRLQHLEKVGWVRRKKNEQDARSILVELTESGLSFIDQAVELHVAHERDILAKLPAEALSQLNASLSQLLLSLEPEN